MSRELDLFGVYFPALLVILLATMPGYWLVDGLLARIGFYRWVWHIDLFRLSLFILMFAVSGAYAFR